MNHLSHALRRRRLSALAQRLARLGAVVLCALAVAVASAQEARGRWITVEATAYCPCELCCGAHADGFTANMTNVARVPYAFAADRSLPFGTRVWVPVGHGVLDNVRALDRWFVVDDRGGALDTEAWRYGMTRLDLRVREHAWAVKFGRRTLRVFIAPPL